MSPGPLTLRLVLPVPEGLLRTPASALSRGSGRLTWPDTRPHLSSSVPDKSWLTCWPARGCRWEPGRAGRAGAAPRRPPRVGPSRSPTFSPGLEPRERTPRPPRVHCEGRGPEGAGPGRVTRGAGQWGARPGPSLLRAFAAPAASREPGSERRAGGGGGGSAAATRAGATKSECRTRGRRPQRSPQGPGTAGPGRRPAVRRVQVGAARRGRTRVDRAWRAGGWRGAGELGGRGRASARQAGRPHGCPRLRVSVGGNVGGAG